MLTAFSDSGVQGLRDNDDKKYFSKGNIST